MNKKVSLGAAICFMAIAAAVTFTITMYFSLNIFNSKIANVTERDNFYDKIEEIDTIVRNNFLETIDEDKLMDSVADGYMAGLDDPYTRYMNQEEYKAYQMDNAGELVGIGVTVRMDDSGYILVDSVEEGSPAENAGILAGDLIIRVGDVDVLTAGYSESVSAVRGEEGTTVQLTVRRDNEDIQLEAVRKLIKSTTISYRMIGEDGYIHISKFNETTASDFKNAVADLRSQGAAGLIFDVRNNPGGLLDSVADVLDYLLPEGPIVSSVNKKGETKMLYESDANSVDLPMIVLCNGETASAGELFSAALRDYKKAELVGVNTYGKGIMQTAYTLADGSALSLTTDYYNPPSGINFHGVGLKPDYEVKLTADQELNIFSLDENTDPQLQKAITVLNSQK